MNSFSLAIRLLLRELRSGELTILMLALIIAVTSSTGITLFADRLQRTMTVQAGDFLAADLVITSSEQIPQTWHNKASQLGLDQAQTVEFSSVLLENNEHLLAGIKAVSSKYPLRGRLKIADADYESETVVHTGPAQDEAWIDSRILSALKLSLGDSLTVGEKSFTISHQLVYEPDKRGDLYSLSPRVMINSLDLAATATIQPGSHVHYFFQFSGNEASIRAFNQWVKPKLNPSQRLMDIHEDRPELGAALERAERYLGLSCIIVVLIAGVAIATSTRRYSERHYDVTAILRCLGYKQQDVLKLFLTQFIILGFIGSLTGCFFGWFSQEALFQLLKNLLPQQVALPGFFAVVFGFCIGIAILLGFALPPLLKLKRVSPLRVLRRDLDPVPISALLIYGLAIMIIAVLIWRYTDDFRMTAIILGTGLIFVLILATLVFIILNFGQKSMKFLNISVRLGLQGLFRNKQASIYQILAFSITITAMILIFSVRNNLLENWQQQLPDNAPNHFAMNIFPDQLNNFQQDLSSSGFQSSQFYPVVRGRLVAINDIPVQQIVSKDSQGERATHRDLSLTWSEELPEDNKIVAGNWWQTMMAGQVSIEAKLAQSLNVDLNDWLTFTVGSEQFSAKVTSIRSVKWDTMKPNFYMIFTPKTLQEFPTTYITSFYLPKAKKHQLHELFKKYPAVTLLEVDLIIDQFKSILSQLTQAINYLLYFALLAGFTVLFSSVHSTLDQRIHEGAIMRTLGAKRTLLRQSHLIEYLSLGLGTGVVAVLLSEILLFALYHFVMHLDYIYNPWQWFVVPLLSMLFIGFAGFWGVKDVVNKPPINVLRDV